ncbi:glycoside hydrolase family protein [Novipirellula artificiosorum]|uniref:Glycosyl hydrolase family 49 n=1 Tax=Novipirellula artificiosorum TaxID=2528016 RepID=A0A5C6DQ86_9BACT|nr:hypothetical protein [Novipirellula artificiosorum]TWU38395.1 Glycosyl hydrolase family 49 [Novipirellula artificiosorum]
MHRFLAFFVVLTFTFCTPCHGERRSLDPKIDSVEQLRTHYSGEILLEGNKLTFKRSGVIAFDQSNRGFIWNVPPSITHVVVGDGVMVDGALHLHGDCLIEGVNREHSGFFGTYHQAWPQNHDIKAYKICTIQGFGDGTITVRNLTFKNPRGFFIRGGDSPVHLSQCDFLETRPGYHNHSDGFEGGPGSTIDQCHFDVGDDVIKVYNDVTVTHTTIVMGINSVPIQFGWGSYGSGAKGIFRNVKIYGNVGRGPAGATLVARAGRYEKSVVLEDCSIDTPNGALFHLHPEAADSLIQVTIKGTPIRIKAFGPISTETRITINGAPYAPDTKQTRWDYPLAKPVGCSRALPIMRRDAQPSDEPILRW